MLQLKHRTKRKLNTEQLIELAPDGDFGIDNNL
jgi:hypothetical protein